MAISQQLIQFFLLASLSLAMTTFSVTQEAETQVVQITNPKLSSINMGLDSTLYWLDKMKPGDSKRGATLIADLEKLATRFNRVPKSEDKQYKYIQNRFATLTSAIQSKSGSVAQSQQTNPQSKPRNTTGKPNPKLFTVSKQLDKIEKSPDHI